MSAVNFTSQRETNTTAFIKIASQTEDNDFDQLSSCQEMLERSAKVRTSLGLRRSKMSLADKLVAQKTAADSLNNDQHFLTSQNSFGVNRGYGDKQSSTTGKGAITFADSDNNNIDSHQVN